MTAGKGGVRGISILRFYGLDAAIAQGVEEAAPKAGGQERLLAGEDAEEGGTAAPAAQPSIKPLQGGRVEAIDALQSRTRLVPQVSCINTIAGVTSSAAEGLTAMGVVYAVTSDCHGGRPLALTRTGIFQAPVRWGDVPVALVRFDAPLDIPFNRPQGIETLVPSPAAIATDLAGRVFWTDPLANVVRVLDVDGVVSVFAGGRTSGCCTDSSTEFCGDGRPAAGSCLSDPRGLAVDHATGDVYIADSGNHRVRVVSHATGRIRTAAGVNNSCIPPCRGYPQFGFEGDGGDATLAQLGWPGAIAFAGGSLYIADTYSYSVRRVTPDGVIRAFAGRTGMRTTSIDAEYLAFNDVLATDVLLVMPSGITVAPSGAVYVSDYLLNVIVEISPLGFIHVVAGTSFRAFGGDGGPAPAAFLACPTSLTLEQDGSLLFVDRLNERVRRITAGMIDTVAQSVTAQGQGGVSGDGYAAAAATLMDPYGLAARSDGTLLISGLGSGRVRSISPDNIIDTFAGGNMGLANNLEPSRGDGPAINASLFQPCGISVDESTGDLYIAEFLGHRVVRVSTDGMLVRIAGTDDAGFEGDGGPALLAKLDRPTSVAGPDSSGRLFISDLNNNRVRMVDEWGMISTYAGGGPCDDANRGDGGPAAEACLSAPHGLALAGNGDLFIADSLNHRIRRVAPNGTISTVAGADGPGFDGDDMLATASRLNFPVAVALDTTTDSLVIADTMNHRIRRVNSTGYILALVGTGLAGYDGDGGPAGVASVAEPWGVAVDAHGSVYFSDLTHNRVRQVAAARAYCAPGYSCPCGRVPQTCTDRGLVCTRNSATPSTAFNGYFSVMQADPDGGAPLNVGQALCPVGSYCHSGLLFSCPSGSFGVALRQPSVETCELCEPGSYSTAVGAAAGEGGQSPCVRCPLGSSASSRGSSTCDLCRPGTFGRAISVPFSPASAPLCSQCPSGTWSLHGAAQCTPLLPGDRSLVVGEVVTFERSQQVDSGDETIESLAVLIASASFPIIAVTLLPLLVVLCCWLPSGYPFAHFKAVRLLASIDACEMDHPVDVGKSPVRTTTPVGGAFTLVSLGFIVALAIALILQYVMHNTFVLQRSMPLTSADLAGFSALPGHLGVQPDLASLLPGLTAGFLITVRTMGFACGSFVEPYTASLVQGRFQHSVTVDAVTGAVEHRFLCDADCVPGALSQLLFALDGGCTAVTVTVAGIGAWGTVSLSSFRVPEANVVLATVPLMLEVLHDFVYGQEDREEGQVWGGRSRRGLVVSPPTNIMQQLVPDSPQGARPPVRVNLFLALSNTHTRADLSLVQSLPQLASSLLSLLGFLALGRMAFRAFLGVLNSRGKSLKVTHPVAKAKARQGRSIASDAEEDATMRNPLQRGGAATVVDWTPGEPTGKGGVVGDPPATAPPPPPGEPSAESAGGAPRLAAPRT